MIPEPVPESVAALGTPPVCHRAMPVASLEPGAPVNLLGIVLTMLLALPRALVLAPALIRRRV